MDSTRDEVAQRALRLIGVCATDEPPTADQMAGALSVLDGIYEEMLTERVLSWDVATGVPAESFVPLANWLGAELAPEYGVTPPMHRARAKLRVMASVSRRGACVDGDDCKPPALIVESGADTDYVDVFNDAMGAP